MTEKNPKRHPVLDDVQIGVGTWAWGDRYFWGFGGTYNEDDLRQVFQFFLKTGLVFFDTAEVYGQGKSETYLGKFLSELDLSTKPVKVATKFMPFPWRLGRRSLVKALCNSLKRLGATQIDLYQMHWSFPPVTIETWMDGMVEVSHSGLIKAVGVSNYDRSQTQRAYDALNRHGIALASNQVEFHLLDRKIEKNGLLEQCNQLGVAIIAYSPLAQGVLTGKFTPENPPRGVRAGKYGRNYLRKVQPLLTLLKRIGADHAGKTAAQVALNWCICKGTIPIPGVKNIQQAEQNAGAIGWTLSTDEVQKLDDLSDQVNKED
jgi:aryl-alcohol dehydrogenase-like predicted oxidoreductase